VRALRYSSRVGENVLELFGGNAAPRASRNHSATSGDGLRNPPVLGAKELYIGVSRDEVDERNATDEIILSGYGARVVLPARPPGYGAADAAAVGH